MLPLGREASILGSYSPAIGLGQLGVATAGIQHRLDGKGHAFFNTRTHAWFTVVQDLWLFMKNSANTVTTILAHDGVVVGFAMLLDDVANIAQRDTWFDDLYCLVQAFLRDTNQALGMIWSLADAKHLAGITVKAILDNGDIDIDDVTGFQDLAVVGDAVTNHVIN